MKTLDVVGGVYHESCIWPYWDDFYGSAGRAAAAAVRHVESVTLHSYLRSDVAKIFAAYSQAYGFSLHAHEAPQAISFDYVHSLSLATTRPSLDNVHRLPSLSVDADVVLRFGMVEADAKVNCNRCVFDPQSGKPESFYANGSTANSLAIVANEAEIMSLGRAADPLHAAQQLLQNNGCEVVVIKAGPKGAYVVTASEYALIPAYMTSNVWTIGTGDVFASLFAARWGVHGDSPRTAAELASRAVATYVETMSLPAPSLQSLQSSTYRACSLVRGRVYLAGPFFTIAQRWLIDEARRSFLEFGLEVFSPVHDVGFGSAEFVAGADLKGLRGCDRVFAILDGLDSGTFFEVGVARERGVRVYGLAQCVPSDQLKMLEGSGCEIFTDFVTAIHHAGWKS